MGETVVIDDGGRKEIDIKRYAKVEKIAGGDIEDCRVLKGVMMNKDIIHPKMRRKVESQTDIEISDEKGWEALLQQEEEAIKEMCDDIIAARPDVVVTEKGVSDLSQHYLQKANISVLRRVRKTDNNRIARASGATIVHRTGEIVEKIGDEYFSWFVYCDSPKACSIVLRGASRDVL